MGACSSTLDEKDLDEVDAARLPSNERTDSDVDLGEIDLEVNNDDIAKTLDKVPLLGSLHAALCRSRPTLIGSHCL